MCPVSDPAYPPARQQIYLQVAQPRALVMLARAGSLLPAVRQYVSNELSIKVEIPALQLLDDGTLVGSSLDASSDDMLAPYLAKRDTPTGVVLGPDSVGTLSFTSGSTGIPKGVRGRHFSLTHFLPWIRQRFEMTDIPGRSCHLYTGRSTRECDDSSSVLASKMRISEPTARCYTGSPHASSMKCAQRRRSQRSCGRPAIIRFG